MTSYYNKNSKKMNQQIYATMALALTIFFTSTIILMIKVPSPNAIFTSDIADNVGDAGNGREGKSGVNLMMAKSSSALLQFSRSSPEDPTRKNDNNVDRKQNLQDLETAPVKSDQHSSTTEEEPRLIHILETRFMQNQPNLIQLARARLQLFKAVCLPTVIQQSSWGEFLWVIRTDPDLDEDIKSELIEILRESGALTKNVTDGTNKAEAQERALTYVIGSNENYILSGSATKLPPEKRPFDIQHLLSTALDNPQSIFAGKIESIQLLLNEIKAEKVEKDVIMWTRLDADDGLNTEYMEYIQTQAIKYFLPKFYAEENETQQLLEKLEKEEYVPPQWAYWCAARNIDWFLTDPIHDPAHKNGTVYPVQHANMCVTPGVTVVLQGSFDPLKIPRLDHDKIVSTLRSEGGSFCGRKGITIFNDVRPKEKDDGGCFHMVEAFIIASVRSRTPTSAGMFGVTPNEVQIEMVKRQPHFQEFMWTVMKDEFLISNKELKVTNRYFVDHVYDIAEENAKGQCTDGHSCKASSKDLLQQYTDLKWEMDGSFDIMKGHINVIT